MNKIMLFIALPVCAGIVTYLALNDVPREMEDEAAVAGTTPSPAAVEPAQEAPGAGLAAQEQQRRAAMRAEYARLEQARNDVRKQLGRIKSVIWKLRVPPAQARAIEKRMYQGHILLKNPPLLGAFSSVDEIKRELSKVDVVHADLKDLEDELNEKQGGRV